MAVAARTANSTARLFRTGSAPGRPRQTGQILVLGAAPNFAEQPQKALVRVSSCTWTSSPMTGSYLVRISGEMLAATAITGLILAVRGSQLASAMGRLGGGDFRCRQFGPVHRQLSCCYLARRCRDV